MLTLAYANGRYCWLTQRLGENVLIESLWDTGAGQRIPASQCRVVEGAELDRQLPAIEFFLKGNHEHTRT